MLARYLKENKELLLEEKNRLLDSILIELSRIINVHGLDRHTLVFYSLLIALKDYYRYLLYAESREGIIKDKEEFKRKIFPYLDKIVNLEPNLDPGELYKQSNEILGDLASKWRSYFINYMEPVEREVIFERKPPIEIPKEAKEKLTETIVEAIKREAEK